MFKLIKKMDYKKSVWKNGQGTTEEIYINPETAIFPHEKFSFRLSTATIQGENEFSLFPGYQRILTVIDGLGLILNEKPLRLEEIFQFSGDEKIICKPFSSHTVDLGIIFNDKLVDAEMQLLQFGELKIELDPKKHYFLVCTEGLLYANSVMVKRFETVHFYDEDSIELKSPDVIAMLITISSR